MFFPKRKKNLNGSKDDLKVQNGVILFIKGITHFTRTIRTKIEKYVDESCEILC